MRPAQWGCLTNQIFTAAQKSWYATIFPSSWQMTVLVQSLPAGLIRGVESALRQQLPRCSSNGTGALEQAIECAIFPGGKRIRPVLTLLSASLEADDIESAFAPAAALEFLHTSSLIFDDLPCMDDATVRRGRPALHLQFGEATAILAALALLNRAYGLLSGYPELLHIAIDAIGMDGMIGGQAADLGAGPAAIRNRKTAGLMRLTMVAGSIACRARKRQIEVLARCGEHLGEAFQLLDDIHDRLPPTPQADKTRGQDERHARANNLGELGIKGCQARLAGLMNSVSSQLTEGFKSGEPRDRLLHFLEEVFREAIP